MSLFFDELVRCIEREKERERERTTGSSLSPSLPLSPSQFATEIKTRISFIEFILKNCDLSLSLSQVQYLWNELACPPSLSPSPSPSPSPSLYPSLALSPLFSEARSAFFSWLMRCVPLNGAAFKKPFLVFSPKVLSQLLSLSIFKMNVREIDTSCFLSLSHLLLSNALLAGHLSSLSSPRKFEVRSHDGLPGISFLWNIILNGEREEVVNLSLSLFIRLHLNIAVGLKKERSELKAKLLERCMATVREREKRGSQHTLRAMRVIRRLLEEERKERGGERVKDSKNGERQDVDEREREREREDEKSITLHVYLDGEQNKISYSLSPYESIGHVRAYCASLLEYPPSLVNLVVNWRRVSLSSDSSLIGTYRNGEREKVIHVSASRLPDKPISFEPSSPDTASSLFACHRNGLYSREIYELLQRENEVSVEVYVEALELLMSAPVSPKYAQRICEAGGMKEEEEGGKGEERKKKEEREKKEKKGKKNENENERERERERETSSEVKWVTYLDPLRAGPLSYGLQVIERLLVKSEFETDKMRERRENFSLSFRQRGGFNFLIDIFRRGIPLSLHSHHPSLLAARTRCLGTILNVITSAREWDNLIKTESEVKDCLSLLLSSLSSLPSVLSSDSHTNALIADSASKLVSLSLSVICHLLCTTSPSLSPSLSLSLSLLSQIYEEREMKKVIFSTIFHSSSSSIRTAICDGLRSLIACATNVESLSLSLSSSSSSSSPSSSSPSPSLSLSQTAHSYFLELLFGMLGEIKEGMECGSYFSLLRDLIDVSGQNKSNSLSLSLSPSSSSSYLPMVTSLLSILYSHRSSEKKVYGEESRVDETLKGVLGLLVVLFPRVLSPSLSLSPSPSPSPSPCCVSNTTSTPCCPSTSSSSLSPSLYLSQGDISKAASFLYHSCLMDHTPLCLHPSTRRLAWEGLTVLVTRSKLQFDRTRLSCMSHYMEEQVNG